MLMSRKLVVTFHVEAARRFFFEDPLKGRGLGNFVARVVQYGLLAWKMPNGRDKSTSYDNRIDWL
jgi:hypothetical protein